MHKKRTVVLVPCFLAHACFLRCIVALAGAQVLCTFTTCNSSIPAAMLQDWKDAGIQSWKSGEGTDCTIICAAIDLQCSTLNNRFPRISNESILATLVTHNNRVCTRMTTNNYPFLPAFTTAVETPADSAVNCLFNGDTYDSVCGTGEDPQGTLHRLCACSLPPTAPGSPAVSTTPVPGSTTTVPGAQPQVQAAQPQVQAAQAQVQAAQPQVQAAQT